jgi:putative endonuclease
LTYWVYLLARKRDGTLYLGVTNNLGRRIWEHRNKIHAGFSARYGVDRLVWYKAMTALTRQSRGRRPSRNGAGPGRSR